ncbi:Acetyl esterase/lipase [Caldanaerobius fijiensis DSM 17918]|uniref:Acetyl esterase/lipase n=1 Tax=Caldanaerobius fijiensis DSM 17918 TaxID=1121256 RepID=A0A1M5DLU0_9THEO|nr:alpha/beta hydrolase [Caldanaerobius fijiensis]SHF67844.1 Acetyl esterase/lipase [Caldanaerobius fijiensis DSM 17918]
MAENTRIFLWENDAPGAMGNDLEDRPNLVPYLIDSDKPAGTVIVFPGGGYTIRAEHEGEPIARWINTLGLHAFVLNYRVKPYKYPYILMDAQRAIRLIRYHAREWNIDPGKIGVLGFSAGGHLASSVGTHYDSGIPDAPDPIDRMGCRPDVMVLCYPVITFGDYRHDWSMRTFLGDNPSEELQKLFSNELQVTPDTPPTFLWHTANDDGVPVENSLLFASALSKNKVPFELHIYETGPHGLGLAQEDPHISTWTKLCGEWLKKHLQ